MIHLRMDMAHSDSELLRSLAAVHFAHGGHAEARGLLELALAINAQDHLVLVLLARTHAHLGDLSSAAKLMSEAIRLTKNLPAADLAFARNLCARLKT